MNLPAYSPFALNNLLTFFIFSVEGTSVVRIAVVTTAKHVFWAALLLALNLFDLIHDDHRGLLRLINRLRLVSGPWYRPGHLVVVHGHGRVERRRNERPKLPLNGWQRGQGRWQANLVGRCLDDHGWVRLRELTVLSVAVFLLFSLNLSLELLGDLLLFLTFFQLCFPEHTLNFPVDFYFQTCLLRRWWTLMFLALFVGLCRCVEHGYQMVQELRVRVSLCICHNSTVSITVATAVE